MEEIQSDLKYSHIEAIDSGLAEKVLPSFQNAIRIQNIDSSAKLDL